MVTPSNLRIAVLLPGHQSLDVMGATDYNYHSQTYPSKVTTVPHPLAS